MRNEFLKKKNKGEKLGEIPIPNKSLEIIDRVENQVKKPQCDFLDLIDNSYNQFVPLITKKYYSKHPIPDDIIKLQEEYNKDPIQYRMVHINDCKKQNIFYPHPYTVELAELKYTKTQLSISFPCFKYKSLEDTPFSYIQTIDDLDKLSKTLNFVTEFAVDLEHHSYRSYFGITCLMQISTRSYDYVIDVLLLRQSMQLLRKPFANPKILKVFHGADWDVKWLQRDFGIYVLNMFDTGQASRVLGFERYSLAYLLKEICNIIVDKRYQLSDWRIRPISEEMLKYAREDTHYLLYIYDELRRRLVKLAHDRVPEEPLIYLNITLKQSKEICKTIYQKTEFKDYNYFLTIARHAASLKKVQISVLKLMLKWRDYIARLEDESAGYICPIKEIVEIAKSLPVFCIRFRLI